MISACKFECFCVERSERLMFAGDISGRIVAIEIDSFSIAAELQAHAGGVRAIVAHRQLPYLATLSVDRTVAVWRYEASGQLHRLFSVSVRDLKPSNDFIEIPYVQSESQALGFHDSLPRLATRSGNAGIVEIDFDDHGQSQIRHCVRLLRDADLVSVRYVRDSDSIIAGATDGQVVLAHDGCELRRWQCGNSGIHWAEYISGTSYALASDMCCVIRLDISGEREPLVGPGITRDDLEHITYNPTSRRAFVGSFDRTIYEVDVERCTATRVAFRAPFKCRWVKTLERSPATLLVQCRNGGLYKADADTGRTLAVIKDTPPVLWTGARTADGTIALAGDGGRMYHLAIDGVDRVARKPRFSTRAVDLDLAHDGFTKRMVRHAPTDRLVLGRSNGDVVIVDGDRASRLASLGAAVRDLAVSADLPELYVACEDGQLHKLDLETGKLLGSYRSPGAQPLWTLAYNPARHVIAVAERKGSLAVLSAADLSVRAASIQVGRPKRMKWVDDKTLLFNKSDQLHRLDLDSGEAHQLVDAVGNTIEDFLWDADHRYLVLISYMCTIILCDFETGRHINVVPDQIDYSKGLIWLDAATHPSSYPLDFLTFGRSGAAHHFRICDEKILALGPVPLGATA